MASFCFVWLQLLCGRAGGRLEGSVLWFGVSRLRARSRGSVRVGSLRRDDVFP